MNKILIVDEETNLLKRLYKALKKNGWEIITAENVKEAEYAIKNTGFDLIIMDISMCEVLPHEGLGLLDFVKKFSPTTKVIIMDGLSLSVDKREAYQKGVFGYFEKPIEIRALKEKIRGIKVLKEYFKKD